MELYHGSNVVAEYPKILTNGHYKDFVSGAITREAFWTLVKFKYPTHQIVFCTQKALRAIRFERSYEA